MKIMRACVGVALTASLWSPPAFAINDTIGVTSGAGKTVNLVKFGSNNVISETTVCDATTENQCAAVNGGGALSVAATLNAETTKVIGTVRGVGNVGGVLDAIVAGTYPANALAVGVLNGSAIGRLVGDETNGLWVNIKAGAGSGGTAIADKGAWTVSSTNLTLGGGEFTTGGATACTTGQACTQAMTASRGAFSDINTWAETVLGAPSNYGTSPGAVTVPGVNAFVTNPVTVAQATAASLNATVVGTGTFAVQAAATLNAETTKVIGTVRNVGNAGNAFDAVVAAAYPANALAVGVLNGSNIGRLVGDETNGLWVNIKAGAGSGGTAIADKGAWTVSSTNFTLSGGEFTTGGATACTTGQACTQAMTASRGAFTDVNTWAETVLGAPSAYGTSPGAVTVPGVNAFVTNANTNGQTTMSASSPVALASDQSAIPVNMQVNTGNANTKAHICGTATTVHVSTNTDTQILAASGSTNVYVCDYEFQLTGVGSFYLEKSSTGTCASPTQIGPLWTGLTAVPIGKPAPNAYYRGFSTGASQQLCVHTAALSSTTLDVTVYTDQY
jgi:hypothetical protein